MSPPSFPLALEELLGTPEGTRTSIGLPPCCCFSGVHGNDTLHAPRLTSLPLHEETHPSPACRGDRPPPPPRCDLLQSLHRSVSAHWRGRITPGPSRMG